VTDGLIEDQLDGHARIRTRQHRGEWLLIVHGVLFQNCQVVLDRSQPIRSESSITGEELLEGGVRWQSRPRIASTRRHRTLDDPGGSP
jgi:hypothetical protein